MTTYRRSNVPVRAFASVHCFGRLSLMSLVAMAWMTTACDGGQTNQDSGESAANSDDSDEGDESAQSDSGSGDGDGDGDGSGQDGSSSDSAGDGSEEGDDSAADSADSADDTANDDAADTANDEANDDSDDEAGETDDDGSTGDSGTEATGDDTGSDEGGSSDGGDEDDPIVDFMAPSFDPPGGLTPSEVPLFIVFGFDDNRYTDGMKWVLDTFEGYQNPPGSGNPKTHDGQPARVSFYFTTDSLEMNDPGIKDEWLRVAELRHEIANHTHTHRAFQDTMPWDWGEEVSGSNAIMAELYGIDESEILGIRAPFLQHDGGLFDTIEVTQGMIYDCSVTHTPSGDGHEDWTFKRHIWPYTLDDDFYFNCSFASYGKRPGMWEIPVYSMPYGATKPTRAQTDVSGHFMAGFDSTAYGTLKLSANDFLNSMKWALEYRMEEGSSRAPLTIGVHSDTYSEKHKAYDDVASLAERRKAIVDFLDFAMEYPEVRIVTAKQLLQWMSNPVPLAASH